VNTSPQVNTPSFRSRIFILPSVNQEPRVVRPNSAHRAIYSASRNNLRIAASIARCELLLSNSLPSPFVYNITDSHNNKPNHYTITLYICSGHDQLAISAPTINIICNISSCLQILFLSVGAILDPNPNSTMVP